MGSGCGWASGAGAVGVPSIGVVASEARAGDAAGKLKDGGKSLLPIGVISVEGDFHRGDVIAVRRTSGDEIGRGLSNYGSAEARLIARKASSEFVRLLGFAGEPELIHRDNLVLA